ncbi:glutamate-cysteine ligase family protein [Halopenitus persicus]|uniref:Gamma-glutamyl:cysteine ligase YbdK, ATP-grasp superfamily n=1 Tax=Halopenitus persicus TaxID=1048396 RepID=A0A1H3FKV4_9EURY|nr:glutamate-cysteine ligase family protein [Halopenitus persicus]SDX90998.1 Gamma-glutamyl:cysteine ligase YbdK, ATP-grasp superfamily [Halopenitus persicus]
MRIGIELECWVVDGDGALTSASGIASACPGVDSEFVDPLLEVTTRPHDSAEAAIRELRSRLETTVETAHDRGKRLVPLGTPLGEGPIPTSRDDRTAIQRAVLGDRLDHAAHCAGTHVHFEQVDAVDQLRVLTALDPAFALVATSPYYRGRHAKPCARPHVYRRLCYADYPDHGRLWRYPRSAAEWRDRIDDRCETFRTAAVDAGIDPDRFDAAFTPATAVWSPVRLRDDLGTVEWRAPDAAPPSDLGRLIRETAAIVAAAVERGTRIESAPGTADGPVRVPPFATLQRHVETALDRGLESRSLRRYLDRMGYDVDAYRPVGSRIDGRTRLDPGTVRRLRRRYADRLERDLDRRAPAGQPVPTGPFPYRSSSRSSSSATRS